MLMVGPRPRRRIPRLPPRLQSPGRNSAGRTTTKVRYHRIQYPTYLVIVLRLLQELVERDLLTHGGRWSVSCLRRPVKNEHFSRLLPPDRHSPFGFR